MSPWTLHILSLFCLINAASTSTFFTLATCGKYSQLQQFIITNATNMNEYTIQLESNDTHKQCIECTSNCDASNVPILADLSSKNNANSLWILSSNYYKNNTQFQIQSYLNNISCLDATNPNTIDTILWLQQCNQNIISQQWHYNNINKTISNNNNLCLTVSDYNFKNCSDSVLNKYDYCNDQLPTSMRVKDLVSRMNINEKAQMLQNNNYGVPSLGIPSNVFSEALHGANVPCKYKTYFSNNTNTGCSTSFPCPLLLGATFNRTLWKDVAIAISDEVRALNNQDGMGLNVWTPNINLCRDPRWGRCQEVPGEDVFLTGEYVSVYSKYMQYGEDTKYLKVVSTAKHYADYDQEGNWGVYRMSFNAIVNNKDQVEYYWPVFRTAIQGSANIQSIMCSYNAVNYVPSCGNGYFMNEIARNEWGFDGFIASDCGAVVDDAFTEYLNMTYNGNYTNYDRVSFAINNGCDLQCGSIYAQYIPDSVNKYKLISNNTLNTAISRVLTKMFMLGMMDSDNKVYYKQYNYTYIDNPDHRKLALNAAEQGIILLKNKDNLLPLPKNKPFKIAIIGPHYNATTIMLSNYNGGNNLVFEHSPYNALMRRATKYNLTVQYAEGCNTICNDTSGFNEAINIAKQSDYALVFLGTHPHGPWPNPPNDYSREGESYDRINFSFPYYQLDLLQSVYNTSTPTILININGGTFDLTWPKDNIDAIIKAIYPGEMGGDAIMRILFGDVSPSAKLPIQSYSNSLCNNRNIMDMNLMDNGGITYMYYKNEAIYPFGFGLSYTTFIYEWFDNNNVLYINNILNKIKNEKYLGNIDLISYIVQITNTGNMDSDCVVLGFLTSSEVGQPQKKLFDFNKVFVKMGQSVNVTLSISPYSISLVNNGGEYIRKSIFNVTIGDHINSLKTNLNIIGNEKIILFEPFNNKH